LQYPVHEFITQQTHWRYKIKEVAITHSVIVYPVFTWIVLIHGHQIDPQACLPSIPAQLDVHTLELLLSTIDKLHGRGQKDEMADGKKEMAGANRVH
jgi:hypothetical protein